MIRTQFFSSNKLNSQLQQNIIINGVLKEIFQNSKEIRICNANWL